jgi:hypothetical protein
MPTDNLRAFCNASENPFQDLVDSMDTQPTMLILRAVYQLLACRAVRENGFHCGAHYTAAKNMEPIMNRFESATTLT